MSAEGTAFEELSTMGLAPVWLPKRAETEDAGCSFAEGVVALKPPKRLPIPGVAGARLAGGMLVNPAKGAFEGTSGLEIMTSASPNCTFLGGGSGALPRLLLFTRKIFRCLSTSASAFSFLGSSSASLPSNSLLAFVEGVDMVDPGVPNKLLLNPAPNKLLLDPAVGAVPNELLLDAETPGDPNKLLLDVVLLGIPNKLLPDVDAGNNEFNALNDDPELPSPSAVEDPKVGASFVEGGPDAKIDVESGVLVVLPKPEKTPAAGLEVLSPLGTDAAPKSSSSDLDLPNKFVVLPEEFPNMPVPEEKPPEPLEGLPNKLLLLLGELPNKLVPVDMPLLLSEELPNKLLPVDEPANGMLEPVLPKRLLNPSAGPSGG